jgi:hypothetical protein
LSKTVEDDQERGYWFAPSITFASSTRGTKPFPRFDEREIFEMKKCVSSQRFAGTGVSYPHRPTLAREGVSFYTQYKPIPS